MYVSARHRVWLLFVTILAFSVPAFADNVTISGTVNFSSLDGSSLDHDGAANGVFTVNDGDLTIAGTVNCNDDASTNACSMAFAVSGNFVMAPGSAVYAENRTGGGSGGNVTVTAGGNVVLGAASGTAAGAIVSAGNADTSASSAGGTLTFTAGGLVNFGNGSVVSAAAKGGQAGAIAVTAEESIALGGLVSSGPSSTLASTRYTGAVLSGGSSSHTGGRITIVSHSHTEPALVVTSGAVIVSQGGSGSAGAVTLEGCGIDVRGLVASISASGSNANVTINSGTTVTIDGSNLGSTSGTSRGMVRADALDQSAAAYNANVFAREAVAVYGPAAGTLYAVTSNGGTTSKDASGTVRVISTGGTVTATGNAFAATNADSGDQGGTITVAAAGSINFATAKLNASGDQSTSNPDRAGGSIRIRSHSGAVSWQNGSGDVRPTGSSAGIAAAKQGTIIVTYCTSFDFSGSTFPSNGAPVGAFPATAQSCTPAAPALPLGTQHPDCNDPPVVANDAYIVDEGGTLNVAAPGVLANDVDPDGDAMTATLVSGPAHASSFTFNADGSFSYTHDGSENHTDTFSYRASDGTTQSSVATVTINVTPVNDAPVANDDSYTVAEGGTINYAAPGVLANDSDSDGPANTAVLVSGPANAASFTLNADGSFIYVHNGGETTSDSFSYKASDGSLESGVATVSITITAINDAPVANGDSASVDEGGTINGSSVLANDTDAENESLTAVLVSGPANASSFALNADGTYTYVHNGGETTSDSFTYKANDGSADSNVATVSIAVNPVNDAPVANADAASVDEGGTVTGDVLANDTDGENSALTATLVSGPAHAASFTLNADGTFSYTHDGSETTSDSFTYKANDGAADSNVVTVTITVNPVNDVPVANADSASVDEGGTLNGTSVLANDTDGENGALTAVLVSGPANAASFTLNADGTYTYVHNGGETTSDSFTYKANDGSADSNVVTVSIAVNPVNDAPVANADSASVDEGGTVGGNVLTNDTDADNATFTAVLVSGPANAASFTLNADGTFSYVHNGGETTSDSFTYKVNDGAADSNVATVSITVNPVNDAPVANGDSASVDEGGTLNGASVLANDTDGENSALTAVLVSGPAHASSFTLNADGTYTYVHNGGETTSDSFSYKANDGSADSNVVTVSIAVNAVNDAPVANGDSASVDEAGTVTGNVLSNDTDADNSTLSAVLVSGPAHAASFALNANGSFTYVHDGSETTSDSFTYKANDGSADSNVVTVTIAINALNDAPVANADSASVDEAGTLNGSSVLSNDTDAENSSLTAVLVSGPAHASSFTLNADGTYTYVHNGGETTSDSFTYKANDGAADSNVVTVSIAINALNDAPVATADSYSTSEGGTINGTSVLANDTDAENSSLTAVLVSGPANASSFTLNADGTFTYVHDGGETTSDSFSYKANDGTADSNVVTVSISIAGVNDVPVAVAESYSTSEGGTLNVAAPGVLGNDTDGDGSSLTAVLVTGPANASSFALNADGSFTYVHNGSETTADSFSYKANDGTADSNVVTVSISVAAVNDAPVAANDAYSATPNTALNVAAPGVLGNDTDADSASLTAVLVSGPSNASSFTFNADGSFSYTAAGSGTDSFTYSASDGSAQSNLATVTITAQSLPPVAADDAYTAVGNTELRVSTGSTSTPHVAVTGSVLANDTDADTAHGSLSVTGYSATSANGGTVSMTPSGTFTYRPNAGSTAPDSFQYTVSDGTSSDTGTVRITFVGNVWYVRNNASAGDGRSHAPFTTLAAAQAASSVNDFIYVHRGDGTTAGHAAISLQNGQRLIGEGAALVVGPYTLAASGSRPRLTAVTLGSGNTVAGLDVNASGAGISGSGVTGGTISSVGVSGGTAGVSLSSVSGSFALTNVTIAPASAGTGLSISGSASVNATNVQITTSGATGLSGIGTGTLTLNGGSVKTTGGTAVDLADFNVAGSGLISVTASNGVNGINLSNTAGTFTVAGTGTAGSGGTISGMSNRGVNAVNAAGLSLAWMSVTGSAQQGLFAQAALSGASAVTVSKSVFNNNVSNAVQTSNSGTGTMSVTIDGNTFTSNNAAAVVQTTAGGLVAKVTNNVSTFNASNAFNVVRNNTGTGVVEATITGNTVGTAGVAGSGSTCGGGCNGILVASNGSNAFRLLLSNNQVREVDAIGIRVLGGSGSSALAATVTNNIVADPVAGAATGIQVQSGSLSADTTSVCAHIAGNTVTGAWTNHISVRNAVAGSTFSLPGYAGLGTDTTAVANFIKSQNSVTTVSALRKTTAPANQFSGGAACATPAP